MGVIHSGHAPTIQIRENAYEFNKSKDYIIKSSSTFLLKLNKIVLLRKKRGKQI